MPNEIPGMQGAAVMRKTHVVSGITFWGVQTCDGFAGFLSKEGAESAARLYNLSDGKVRHFSFSKYDYTEEVFHA